MNVYIVRASKEHLLLQVNNFLHSKHYFFGAESTNNQECEILAVSHRNVFYKSSSTNYTALFNGLHTDAAR